MAGFELGSYTYASDEGCAKYTTGCPVFKLGPEYKYSLAKEGELYICTEYMGDKCTPYSFKLDTETKYCSPTVTQVTTKTGVNQFKTVIRMPDGDVHEFARLFTDEGIEMNCFHLKSGNTCKLIMKRFTDMSGEYKLVSHTGLIEFGKALGAEADMVKKVDFDMDSRMIIEEKDGVFHHVYKSAVLPIDISFKMGVEFDYKNPLCGHAVLKGMAHKKGDIILIHFKGKNIQFTTTLTFTKNFLIKEVQMVNSGVGYKSILAKVN